jgi:hypothetical protein
MCCQWLIDRVRARVPDGNFEGRSIHFQEFQFSDWLQTRREIDALI